MATAATPTSNPEPALGLVPRFGRTERALHWVHAVGFFGMLASGLVLYLPGLSGSIGDRPTTKAVHLGIAAAWMTAIALIAVGGDQRALRRTRREIEHFRDDDVQWLRGRKTPQGRFNAGQKSHAVAQSALAALFVGSGVLLWLGERDTVFRLPGTVALHDGAMFLAVALVLGHLFLSLVWPTTRPALRGIVRGTVRADWAREHHAAWTPSAHEPARQRVGTGRRLVFGVLLLAGAGGTVALVATSLPNTGAEPAAVAAATPAAPALRPGADTLAIEAQQATQAGQFDSAVALLRQAVRQAPARADLQTSLGTALAQAGDTAAAQTTLERAIALDPKVADAHLVLGAVRVQSGDLASGRAELRTYLRLAPRGANVRFARDLLRRR